MSRAAGAALVALAFASPASAGDELARVLERVLAPPKIETAAGFRAKLLVPPGELYDPLFMIPRSDGVWLADDGREEAGVDGRETTGSRIVAIDSHGRVSVVVGADRTVPMIAPGIAPASFGARAGKLVVFSQAKAGMQAAFQNHIIQALDPASREAPSTICTLPNAGSVGNGIPGVGAGGGFGPPGTPFADRFFAALLMNAHVYQMDAAGRCTPFADFAAYGAPVAFGFSADGKKMLVSVTASNRPGDPVSGTKPKGGKILAVSPDGEIDPEPVAGGFDFPAGIAVAPEGFGAHAGELFVADAGASVGEVPVPATRALQADGRVYRVTAKGALELVASGFHQPTAVLFVGGKLWVTDINGDFIGGKRELPDGYVVEIAADGRQSELDTPAR